MLIYVNHLIDGQSEKVLFDGYVQINYSQIADENVRVNLDGTIQNVQGKFKFIANVYAFLKFFCSACLKEFSHKLCFNIEDTFEKNSLDNNIWVFIKQSYALDLESLIVLNLLSNLPMKPICSLNCKGLCFKCGHDLNNDDCGCDRTFVDPRFESVLKMFKDKEV